MERINASFLATSFDFKTSLCYCLSSYMPKPEVKTLTFYPWNLSATGSWSPDTGIYYLRDMSPEELADLLWEPGIHVQNTAIIELMAHGNPRKAAEVARALVKKHPVVEESIREGFKDMADYLLRDPLESIPSSPSEYPKHVKIAFIQ